MKGRSKFREMNETLEGYGFRAAIRSVEDGTPDKFECEAGQGDIKSTRRARTSPALLTWLDGYSAGVADAARVREQERNGVA